MGQAGLSDSSHGATAPNLSRRLAEAVGSNEVLTDEHITRACPSDLANDRTGLRGAVLSPAGKKEISLICGRCSCANLGVAPQGVRAGPIGGETMNRGRRLLAGDES